MEQRQQLTQLLDLPIITDELRSTYIKYVFRETDSKRLDLEIRNRLSEIRNGLQMLRQRIVNDTNLMFAYYDIARYQTDVKDAAIDWGVSEELLCYVLKERPVPITPEERHSLDVPHEVQRMREHR